MRILVPALSFFLTISACFSQQAFSDILLTQPQAHSKEIEAAFVYKELPVYTKNTKEKSIFLKNGYASSVLQTPGQWPLKQKSLFVKEINIIFTKYPKEKNFWNTNYYDLLAERLKNLFILDPALNDSRISYSLVLQTACNSEAEAKEMLHGIEIVYQLGERGKEENLLEEPDFIDSLYLNQDSLNGIRDLDKARKFVKKSKAVDTVVLEGLDLFNFTDSLLVVIDVTGSMAPYYSQVTLWAARNFYPGHYYVLFNDGGNRSLPIGKTGGYEDGRVESVTQLIKLFKKASSLRGKNREFAENDIEGLLVGINAFPENKGVILLADNNACIRDYSIMHQITRPVHIIPCGGITLNPQFLNLAQYTGGSVFWLDQRINDWPTLCNGDIFNLGDDKYRFLKTKQRFELLNEDGKHKDFCDVYTNKLKKKR